MNTYALGAAAMATAIGVLVVVLVFGVSSPSKPTVVTPARPTFVPASWQKVTFGGLTMYAPGNWSTIHSKYAFSCGIQYSMSSSRVTLDGGVQPPPFMGCPDITAAPIPPLFGLVVDPGQYGPFYQHERFTRCLHINDLSVCPTSTNFGGILVLAVHIPGHAQPVAVEIGLAGGGKVAHTIEYSMRAATFNPVVPPKTPTTVAATGGPWPSLVYAGPGVEVVGISPEWDRYEGTKPSRLYLSTDMRHWTDITSPQSQVAQNGIYGYFDHASFVNTSIGWVTTYNNVTDGVTIYRTRDGGKTWTTVLGGSHTFKGDMLIQLLSPSTAIRQILEPTAPEMSLGVTTNAGESWRTGYTGPRGVMTGQRAFGPFLMPTTFLDADHGFAATGDPQTYTAGPGDGDFFSTNDGGSRWTRETPLLPSTTDTCPSGDGWTSSTSCIFALPTFDGTERGVLPGIVVAGAHAREAMGRNHLKGRDGDRINAVLAAAGYNFSLLRRWFERLLRALWLIIGRAILASRLA